MDKIQGVYAGYPGNQHTEAETLSSFFQTGGRSSSTRHFSLAIPSCRGTLKPNSVVACACVMCQVCTVCGISVDFALWPAFVFGDAMRNAKFYSPQRTRHLVTAACLLLTKHSPVSTFVVSAFQPEGQIQKGQSK